MPDGHCNETTLDGFLDNQFKVIQPKSGSHRSGLDAVLLAACIPDNTEGSLADFGAGCGVAGMAVAQRCSNLSADLIELDAMSASLCEQSLKLAENAHLTDRISIVQGDVTSLKSGAYNHIIANPPYNDGRHQASPSSNRAGAHVMDHDLLENWIKAAARLSAPKASLFLILRPESIATALTALGGRFGALRILPVHSKADEKANRILIKGIKASKGRTEMLPAFVVHENGGKFTNQAEDVFRGRAGIAF